MCDIIDMGTQFKYPVGYKFILKRGKRPPQERTVIDLFVTLNNKGDIVKKRYVTSHNFMGQTIIDADVVQTTIDMAAL